MGEKYPQCIAQSWGGVSEMEEDCSGVNPEADGRNTASSAAKAILLLHLSAATRSAAIWWRSH